MDSFAVRRLLYNTQGFLKEKFALVELPGALYAGFRWTLQELQLQSSSAQRLAFESTIAPSSATDSPRLSPPDYSTQDDFVFDLAILRKDPRHSNGPPLTFKPANILSDQDSYQQMLDQVRDQTTLDEGQATALCESLCRSLAFTQGPPGTGKTYLGVALARVLLASRPSESRLPILVVCLTNHALDSFLGGLWNSGIANIVRYGGHSKEDWTKPFQKQNVSRRFKNSKADRSALTLARTVADGHGSECQSWCEALNEKGLSWPSVREHLQVKDPATLAQFTAVEKADTLRVSDIRLARKAGGFAFEFWCQGGDIKDVKLLLETFRHVLGDDSDASDLDPRAAKQREERVLENIRWNLAEIDQYQGNTDIWKLPILRRQQLSQQWKHEIGLQTILDRTAEAHRRHQVAVSEKRKVFDDIDLRMLGNMDVIAMTTTACAMHRSILQKVGVQIVMCEEAAEVMEAQFLCTLMPSVGHHISIGDPLQLRPQVNEQSLSLETPQGSAFRLDESLMERFMIPKTPGVNPIPTSTLNIQRRMHPEIAELMRATLYPFLKDHESTWEGRSVHGLVDRIWWLDHQIPEDGEELHVDNPTSCSNKFEVDMIAGLVGYLVDSNEYDYKDITILTPYNGQLAALTQKLKGLCSLWLSEKDRDTLCKDGLLPADDMKASAKTQVDVGDMLRLATIDNFQGEESKIVILSAVRSNASGRVGFMKTVNRINVACSRARNGFYIIGNAALMRTIPMWRQITSVLESKEKIGPGIRACCSRHPDTIYPIQKPHEWYEIPPCQRPCDFEFACGHKCTMTCHAMSLHDRMGCTQPCEKQLEKCGHPCSRLCGQPCGDCTHQEVAVRLPCGHDSTANCVESKSHEAEAKVVCKVKVATEILLCGHEQDILCSSQGCTPMCMEKCDLPLSCGHTCGGICAACITTGVHPPCEAVCQKKYQTCDHICLSKCHPASACPPCKNPCPTSCRHRKCSRFCGEACMDCMKGCNWKCEHMGQCSTLCCLPCDRFPCQQNCAQMLTCGHRCPSLCGEACPQVCPQCQSGKVSEKPQMFLSCGHSFDVEELDRHVGIQELYDTDDHDKTFKSKKSVGEGNINATCPVCGQSCASSRRYALHHQMQSFPKVLDSIYSRLYRKLCNFLDVTYSTKGSLDSSFRFFQESLQPGPLNGRKNELKIRERSIILQKIQASITGFKGTFLIILICRIVANMYR